MFFLKKNKKKNPFFSDYSDLKVDIHSHLIPNIDDGSESYEMSLDLIRGMVELGFKKLITTPHVMSDFYKNTPAIINLGLEKLRYEVEQAKIPIKIEVAAEYMIDDGFANKLEKKEILTINGNYLLIELSKLYAPSNLKDLLFKLQVDGYKIILAHPERYIYWEHDFKQFEELKKRNIFFQMNTVSLIGFYSDTVRKLARKLIDADMIDFLGSDIHNYNYLNALQKSVSDKYIQKLLFSKNLKNQLLV